MTRCETYMPWLAAMADGEIDAIPAEVRQELDAHLASCPACRAELARQGEAIDLLARDAAPPVPEKRWQQMWQAVDAQTTGRPATRRFPLVGWQPYGAIAASVAVAAMVLIGVLVWQAAGPGPTPGVEPIPTYAFASHEDADIQAIEAADDEMPMVITSGNEDLMIVWVVHDTDETRKT